MSPARISLAIATVLVGLSAGFFFAYQISVTRGLAQVDDIAYVNSFQAINDTVGNAWFAIVFFGSIPAIGTALVVSWRSGVRAQRAVIGLALGLYLAGLVVTGTGNVPLNDELADYTELTPALAAEARADFEDSWNQLNLIRTLAITASFAALVAATSAMNPSE